MGAPPSLNTARSAPPSEYHGRRKCAYWRSGDRRERIDARAVYASGVDEGGQEQFLPVVIFGLVSLPTVTTGAPRRASRARSAMVSGTVNPEGTEVTTCEFEYGPTVAYGRACRARRNAAARRRAPVTVSAEITFLAAARQPVHYRLKAGGSAGDEFGAGETFTLASFPPTRGRRSARVGHHAVRRDAQRHARNRRRARQLPLRIRHHHRLRADRADPRRLHADHRRTAHALPADRRPAGRHDLPLPAGREQPRRHEVAGPDETFTTLRSPPPRSPPAPRKASASAPRR